MIREGCIFIKVMRGGEVRRLENMSEGGISLTRSEEQWLIIVAVEKTQTEDSMPVNQRLKHVCCE